MNAAAERFFTPSGSGVRALFLGIALAGSPSHSRAESPPWGPLIADISAEPLKLALEDLAHQTGLEIYYLPEVVGDRVTRGCAAGLSATDAASRLLEGTGLEYEFLSPRAIRILRNPLPADIAAGGTLTEIVVIAQVDVVPEPPATAPANPDEQQLIDTAEGELERRIEREGLMYRNAGLERYLQDVADQLRRVDTIQSPLVRIHVIKSVRPNAFALSNGSVYLTTALLVSLEDESQLAAVLAHELAHYSNHHELRALRTARRRARIARTIDIMLRAAFGFVSLRTNTPLQSQSSAEPVVLGDGILGIWDRTVVTGYSKDLEREADHVALHRLVAAGYDPRAAPAAFDGLAAHAPQLEPDSPSYASAPHLAEHAANCRAMLRTEFAPIAGQERAPDHDMYRLRIARLPLEQVAMLVEAGSFDRAEQALAGEIAEADSGPAEFLRGEIARRREPGNHVAAGQALLAYERALAFPDAPASAYRWAGIIHRERGESAAAARDFEAYLERAPGAVDAELVRVYLEDLEAADSRARN